MILLSAFKDAFAIFVLQAADDRKDLEPVAGVPAADSDGNLFSQFGKVPAREVADQTVPEKEEKRIEGEKVIVVYALPGIAGVSRYIPERDELQPDLLTFPSSEVKLNSSACFYEKSYVFMVGGTDLSRRAYN